MLICKFRDYCTSALGRNGPLKLALIGRDVDLLAMATHSRCQSFPSESTPKSIFAEKGVIDMFTGIKLDPDYGENVDSDIARFTRWSLEPLRRIHGFDTISSQIEQTLLARAEGTFLWVGFVIYELSKKRTRLQILETVQDVPSGLHTIFERMLHRIDSKHRHISASIFKWLAVAMRPLTLRELASAVGSGIKIMADRIAICQPLLKLDDDRVLFIHQSARECLLRKQPDEDPIAELFRMDASKCHGEIAHRCLRILENSFLWLPGAHSPELLLDIKGYDMQPDITRRDQLPELIQKEPELFAYAFRHWMKHTRQSPRDAQYLFDFSRPFFQKSSDIRNNWATSNRSTQGRLHMASFYGIIPWLQGVREEGDSMTFHGTRRWRKWVESTRWGYTPLGHAVFGDFEDVVRFLLHHGADMEGGLFSALSLAVERGAGTILDIFLQHGARITNNSPDRSLLITAAREGSIDVVQLLLNHGADINIRNDQNETPLTIAATYDHQSLVGFLLGHGAHLDVEGFRVWLRETAQIPKSRWSTAVVQTILHRVPDICWAGEDGGRLLHLAAEWADHEIAQLCLAKGVDINWKHPNGVTALVQAILEDRSRSPPFNICESRFWYDECIIEMEPGIIANKRAMVAFLLDHGADPNLKSDFPDGSLRPPLVAAARRGADWAVEQLIEYGADCNARAMVRKPEPKRHRLASAFRRTHIQQEPKELILGGSALLYEVQSEQVSTVWLLLAYGANTRLLDEYERTALQYACLINGIRQYAEIIQVLVDHDEAMGRSVR